MVAAQDGARSVLSTSGCSHTFNPLSALPRNRFAAFVLRVTERQKSMVFPSLPSARFRHALLPCTLT